MTKEVKETKVKETPKKEVDKKDLKDNEIIIGGKKYSIRFPIASIIKMQKEAGIKISDLEDEETAQDLEVIVAVIWAGLVADSPKLTVDYLADNIEFHELGTISEKVVSVMMEQGKKE